MLIPDDGRIGAVATEACSEPAKTRSRNRYFHSLVDRLIASQVVPGSTIVDIGCSDGSTLRACRPSKAIGVDLESHAQWNLTSEPAQLEFRETPIEECQEPGINEPDYVLLSMVLDEVHDIQEVLGIVRSWVGCDTRLIIASYSRLWRPLIKLAEVLRIKSKAHSENYVPWVEVENMLELENYEVTKRIDGVLMPIWIPLISSFINRWIAPLPLVRALCLMRITVARPLVPRQPPINSVSIVVAARNEEGHIRELIERIPQLAKSQEVIFVEGHSSDRTWDAIQQVIIEYEESSNMRVRGVQQPGKGKGDAIRAGFELATGDVLMILDADISVPPEELPKFISALSQNHCEFANGSRLVYPMDAKAMRFLNLLGNKFFGYLFSYLLGQPIRDTLCGTKVMRRKSYDRLVKNRSYFGDFDPFGDFDLLFGASYLGLRIRDVPVHYKERRYGSTNISRFSHGALLMRMSGTAARRLKFIG